VNNLIIKRKVTRVIDGGTFEIARKIGGTNRIRIAGLNAPELSEKGGIYAKAKLKDLIEGRIVTITPVSRSFGRIAAGVRKKNK